VTKPKLEKGQPVKVTPTLSGFVVGSLACAILCVFIFAWLAEEVLEGQAKQFDAGVRGFIHQFASPTLTRVMQTITLFGSVGVVTVLFAICLGIFLLMKWWRAATWLGIAMAGAMVLDFALKQTFHRTRPVPFFGPTLLSYSFPSGHALGSFCFYGVLAGLLSARMPRVAFRSLIWIVAGILVFAIGISRIYLGVHYPTDVVAGYLAAAVWISTLLVADRFWLPGRSKRKA
jgi:undecaprenyl-diphosphatase